MKILKFIGKTFLTLLLLSLIFWTLVLVILQTKSGQEWIFDKAVKSLEKETGAEIKVESITFSFPLHLQLNGIRVSYNNHPFFNLDSANIECSFPKLIEGRVIFSEVQLQELTFFSYPRAWLLQTPKMIRQTTASPSSLFMLRQK